MLIDNPTVDEVREAYEALIKEKDQRIAELEQEIADLKEQICGLQDQLAWEACEDGSEDDDEYV